MPNEMQENLYIWTLQFVNKITKLILVFICIESHRIRVLLVYQNFVYRVFVY